MGTTSSYATKPVANSKIYYENDEEKSTIRKATDDNKMHRFDAPTLGAKCQNYDNGYRAMEKKSENDFPALGARIKTPKLAKPAVHGKIVDCSDIIDDEYDSKHLNPWTNRSRFVPREPKAENFSIDYSKQELDTDDYNSVASYGRGRGSILNTSISSFYAPSTSSVGRGRGKRC